MSEKPKTLFRVSDLADRTVVRVAAKSNAAARKYAASLLKVDKMSVAETISAAQNGYAIIDAESGTAIGAEAEAAPTAAGAVKQDDED